MGEVVPFRPRTAAQRAAKAQVAASTARVGRALQDGARQRQRETERLARRRAAAEAERTRRESLRMARAEWKAGRVRPWRITAALDLRKLYGPAVDRACGAVEPAVDLWEAGDLYPSWEQLQALSKLTEFPVGFFVRDGDPLGEEGSTIELHLKGRGKTAEPEPVVLQFSHQALVNAGIREGVPDTSGALQDSLF